MHIWNVNDKRSALQATLSPHSRPVADLCWALSDPNVLATCSADMYVILSDVRAPKSPVKLKAFCAWTAGATMVKWNRRNPRLIASVHDGEVFVWDVRKESAPISKITAHKQISSMDWSYHSETQLVTSSTDRTVKFWDYNQPTLCQAILQTGNPVSKVRYTPFGRAIITISQRSDFTVRMWSLNDLEQPVYQFMGHKDVVSALDWRTCDVGEDYEYQLLSWSKDSNLRFWPIDMALINAMQAREAYGAGRSVLPSASTSLAKDGFGSSLGIYPSVGNTASFTGSERDIQATPTSTALGSPRKGSGILGFGASPNPSVSTPNGGYVSNSTIANLEQELAIMQRRPIQSVIIEESSLSQRTLQLRIGRLPYLMRLKITFPSLYPNLAAPSFEFLNISDQETRQLLGLGSQSPQTTASLLAGPSKLSEEEKLYLKVKAKQLLVKVAYAFVSINLVCVDPCCNLLLELLESFHADPKLVLQPDDPDKELRIKPEEYYKSYSLSSGSVPSTPSRPDDNSSNTLSTSLGKERTIPRLTFSESASGNGATSTVTQIAFSPPLIKPQAGNDTALPKTKSDMNLTRFLDNDYLHHGRSGSSSGALTPAGSSPSSTATTIPSISGNSSQTSTAQGIVRLPASQSATNLTSLVTPTDPSLPVTSSSLVDKSVLQTMHQAASTTPHIGPNNVSASSTNSGPLSPHSVSSAPSSASTPNSQQNQPNLDAKGMKGSADKISISANATANFANPSNELPTMITTRATNGDGKGERSSSGLKPLSQHAATITGLARLGHRDDDVKLSAAEAAAKLRMSSDFSDDASSEYAHSLVGDDYLSNPVPAPRTCGAFFYATGHLCIFGSKQRNFPPGIIPASKLANHARTYPEFVEVIRATSLAKRSSNVVRASHDDLTAYDAFSLDLENGSDGAASFSVRDSAKLPRTVSMSAMSDGAGSESGADDNGRDMLHKVSSDINFSHHNHHHSGSQMLQSHHHLLNQMGLVPRSSRRELKRGDIRVEWYDSVAIHDLSMLIPVNPLLAKLYTLSGTNPSAVAQLNIMAAKSVRRMDLAKLWSVVEAQLSPSVYPGLWSSSPNPDGSGSSSYSAFGSAGALTSHGAQIPLPSPFDRTWAMHPLGKTLLKSLFKRYEQLGDVQTLAMLSCVITGPSTPYGVDALFPAAQRRNVPHKLHHQRSSSLTTPIANHALLSSYGPSPSPSGPSSSSNSSAGSFSSLTSGMIPSNSSVMANNKPGSNSSASSSASNSKALAMSHMGLLRDRQTDSPTSFNISGSHSRGNSNPTADAAYLHHSLVEYEDSKVYNGYRRAYAEILYMWGEFAERANVLKYVADPTPPNDGIDFVILCDRCSKPLKTPYCQNCKIYGFNCDICHLKVKGLSSFCLKCGHGGHAEHLKKWFEKEKVCPTGCGCECMSTDGHF